MKDLTKGNAFKLILLFALPVFLGNVLQQLYNLVDTIIVGWAVNSDAFTGVGLTGSISFFVTGFASGLTSGFGVCVAQRFGAADREGVRRSVAMSYLLCIITAVVVTAASVPLTGVLLRLIKTPEQYFDYAFFYLITIFSGLSATMFYNVNAGILRAVGDSKAPLYILILAVVLNIGLDFLFILCLKLYYIGAALATVLSQLLSGGASLAYMLKRYPELRLKKEDWKWSGSLAGAHLAVGLPMALQFSITAIGCIVQQAALNGLDETYPGAVTAYAAAAKIDNISSQSFVAIGTAMATFAGQNYGAQKLDRVKKGAAVGMIYTLIFWVVGFAFCFFLGKPLMKLFLNTENGGSASLYYDDILRYGRQYLTFQSGCYLLLGTIYVYRNTLQGIGKSAVTMLSGVFELVGRFVTSFVFVSLWGFTGICISNPFAWLLADVFLLTTYFIVMHCSRRKHRFMKRCRNEA